MTRATVLAIAVVITICALLLLIGRCSEKGPTPSQERVEDAQAGAATNSAVDAINTVSGAAERQSESEQLTRDNEKQIREAEGANNAVNPAVRNAGRSALCLRDAYRNDPKCRVQ